MKAVENSIRTAQAGDAERLADLCTQLGYPSSVDDVRARLPQLIAGDEQTVFVATGPGGEALGWVHVRAGESLVMDRYAEIGGLVVDAHVRSAGVGRQLMAAAEAWAREHRCTSVRLRSNVVRTRAHEFYKRLGYQVMKTSLVFAKEL